MSSDAVAFEVFMTGHGPSKTETTETTHANCSWDIREVVSVLGESTNSGHLGWCLLQPFLFSWPRWVYYHASVYGVMADIPPLGTDRFRSNSRPTNELDEHAIWQYEV